MKRSLPVSPPVMTPGSQSTPAKKSHRVPLLPTPDAAGGGSTVAPFVRQGGCGCIFNPRLLRMRSEGYCSPFCVCVCVCCREMQVVNVKVKV